MKILISGASGFIGSALMKKLNPHEVWKLVRKKNGLQKNEIYWNPVKNEIESDKMEGFDAIIHLAGESIVGRWTEEKKKKIRESRIQGTTFLSNTLLKLKTPPPTFLCASAIGYYGNRGNETLDEASKAGKGFLAETCQEWEAASKALQDKDIRVIHYRIGIVLSTQGGALQKMLLPFKMGLGGKLGNGKQWMSWISLEDLLEGILFILQHKEIKGPINAVSPNPVRNEEFTKILGKTLRRPTLLTTPAFALKLTMGKMAEEVLLAGAKVLPSKLQKAHYNFKYPDLEIALKEIIPNNL